MVLSGDMSASITNDRSLGRGRRRRVLVVGFDSLFRVFPEQPLDPRMRLAWIAGTAIRVLVWIALAAALTNRFLPDQWEVITTTLTLAGLTWAMAWPALKYRNWSIRLDERHLVVRHGVVWRRERLVPRTRVQHVDISSGPLDRAFGLRQLAVYTAGSRSADVGIPGLAPATAEGLRAALVGSTSESEPDAHTAEEEE